MQSKNKRAMTAGERAHVDRVKLSDCAVCDAPGPCDAHEINQGQWFTAIALCKECHTGGNGWHGSKALWRIRKLDELGALNITLGRIYA